MFTDSQRELFSKILDANWDATIAERDGNLDLAGELYIKRDEMNEELKISMGEDAYNRFIDNGKKMFAPKQ